MARQKHFFSVAFTGELESISLFFTQKFYTNSGQSRPLFYFLKSTL